ncbi:sensor histidine kinase [Aeromicrobium sp. 9AM]|uniref:sensor histidine kinase n=1 Tax=Aeromicrobium sp. 9AM TaxID=2653126 RepID=UPI0013576164|nr:histidine kinase [Aeromicrobium sp. 9AM]
MSGFATPEARREWWPDATLGGAVAFVGLAEQSSGFQFLDEFTRDSLILILGFGVAAGLSRRIPGAALVIVWLTCLVQVLSGTHLMIVELAVGIVAFGTARYGSPLVVWLSGLSIPVGTLAAVVVVHEVGSGFLMRLYNPVRTIYADGSVGPATMAVFGLGVLAVPWLLGLLVRSRAQTEVSRADRDVAESLREEAEAGRAQAQEIADLRAEQARLAHDVHDVVGHSLAVILAQAESAQFLSDDDIDRIRQTLENVAVSARRSLQDVRTVLAGEDAVGTATASLDSLVDSLRIAGNDLRSSVIGEPRPLPPELEVVAYRVLQEMLTNALKHGRRAEPVWVERHWEGDLRIEVRNLVDVSDEPDWPIEGAVPDTTPGIGIDGMRQRVESVGGHLDVRRRHDDEHGTTFTTTAWVPFRTATVDA